MAAMSSSLMRPSAVRSAATFSRTSRVAQTVLPFTPALPVGINGRTQSSRGALVVVAAATKNKGLDSAQQRNKLSQEHRLINRTHRSAVNTRIKKVIKLAEEFKAKIEVVQSETDIRPLEQLINEAYSEIDKAVRRNILHVNNGARKKARIAMYKRNVLIQAGLYTPLPDQPGYKAPKVAPLRDSA